MTPQQVTLDLDPAYEVANMGTFHVSGNLGWSNTTQSGSIPITVSDQVTMIKILPR